MKFASWHVRRLQGMRVACTPEETTQVLVQAFQIAPRQSLAAAVVAVAVAVVPPAAPAMMVSPRTGATAARGTAAASSVARASTGDQGHRALQHVPEDMSQAPEALPKNQLHRLPANIQWHPRLPLVQHRHSLMCPRRRHRWRRPRRRRRLRPRGRLLRRRWRVAA